MALDNLFDLKLVSDPLLATYCHLANAFYSLFCTKNYVSCTMGKLVDFYLHTNIKITYCKVHNVMKLELYIVSCWHPFELFDLKLMFKPLTCKLLSCSCYMLLSILHERHVSCMVGKLIDF
jgi:hypothetical protein